MFLSFHFARLLMQVVAMQVLPSGLIVLSGRYTGETYLRTVVVPLDLVGPVVVVERVVILSEDKEQRVLVAANLRWSVRQGMDGRLVCTDVGAV
jgi:hypothetical protein